MTQNKIINIDNAYTILEEIREAYFDIPFTNTDFQTEMFVIAAQITPARAWRTIGLTMQTLIESIINQMIGAEKEQIDLDELHEEIKNPNINKYELRRKELKIKEIENRKPAIKKRISDAINELNVLYKHFIKFPKYSRNEFEEQERLYFEQSLQRQILGLTGAKEAFVNMNEDNKTMQQFEKLYKELPDEKKKEMLHEITKQSLAGYIQLDITKQLK